MSQAQNAARQGSSRRVGCLFLQQMMLSAHMIYTWEWTGGGWVGGMGAFGGGGIDFCEWSSETPTFRVTAAVFMLFVLFQETEHGAEKVRGREGQWGG